MNPTALPFVFGKSEVDSISDLSDSIEMNAITIHNSFKFRLLKDSKFQMQLSQICFKISFANVF